MKIVRSGFSHKFPYFRINPHHRIFVHYSIFFDHENPPFLQIFFKKSCLTIKFRNQNHLFFYLYTYNIMGFPLAEVEFSAFFSRTISAYFPSLLTAKSPPPGGVWPADTWNKSIFCWEVHPAHYKKWERPCRAYTTRMPRLTFTTFIAFWNFPLVFGFFWWILFNRCLAPSP